MVHTPVTHPTSMVPSYAICPMKAPMMIEENKKVLYVIATSISYC